MSLFLVKQLKINNTNNNKMPSIDTMFEINPEMLVTEPFRIETGTFYYVVRYNKYSRQYDILDTNNPLYIDVQ